jgi:hypothetical protein
MVAGECGQVLYCELFACLTETVLNVVFETVKLVAFGRLPFREAYLYVGPGAHIHAEGGRIDDIARVADALVRHDGKDGVDTFSHLCVGVANQLGFSTCIIFQI